MSRYSPASRAALMVVILSLAWIGCDTHSPKAPSAGPLSATAQLTRSLILDVAHAAAAGGNPETTAFARLGISPAQQPLWSSLLNEVSLGKDEPSLQSLLQTHEGLTAQQRRAIEQVFSAALHSTSAANLEAKLSAFESAYAARASGDDVVWLYAAAFRGLVQAYEDLEQQRLAYDLDLVRHGQLRHMGGIVLAQASGPMDGKYLDPPVVIESWEDFLGNSVLAGIALGSGLGAIGAGACSPYTLITFGLGPLGCAAAGGVSGFVLGTGLYAGSAYYGARMDYERRLGGWCREQTRFSIKHYDFDELCNADGTVKPD